MKLIYLIVFREEQEILLFKVKELKNTVKHGLYQENCTFKRHKKNASQHAKYARISEQIKV